MTPKLILEEAIHERDRLKEHLREAMGMLSVADEIIGDSRMADEYLAEKWELGDRVDEFRAKLGELRKVVPK